MAKKVVRKKVVGKQATKNKAKCLEIDGLEFVLCSGVGDYKKRSDGKAHACVMAAAVAHYRFKQGVPLNGATDNLDCCCPVAQAAFIRINDGDWWESEAERTKSLGPYVPLLAGTKADINETVRRAYAMADHAIRFDAADALEAAGLKGHAEKLRALKPVVDKETSDAASYAASDAARASSYAARASSYAASYAASAASDAASAASDAASYAASYAARAASDAASAASDAASYAASYAARAARKKYRDRLIKSVVEICGIKKSRRKVPA